MGILLILSLLYDMAGAHGDGLPMGGKTIAGPGNAGIEKAKPAVILTSKVPLPPACITLMNMTMSSLTVWLDDSPTNFTLGNGTASFCWGKGVKKVSLHAADQQDPNSPKALWRIDAQ